jgi:hypothetical protein
MDRDSMAELPEIVGDEGRFAQSGSGTPVLLLVFNRPESTKAVFKCLRETRPRRLYVAADGPREVVDGEAERCMEARRIAKAVDWECELTTRFQNKNMGLASHVSSAIDWFFGCEPEGIILEDDCIPDPSFFPFCSELLRFYRDVPEVMHISGNNFQYGRRRGTASYYFSRYPHVWGWASWRRAWQHYDFSAAPPEIRASAWAPQWLKSLEVNKGVAITPNVNLVTNIGFGVHATHTKTMERYAMLPARAIDFPLQHPRGITVDSEADILMYYANFRNIPDLRLMWVYRLWDFGYDTLKRVKRWLLRRQLPIRSRP